MSNIIHVRLSNAAQVPCATRGDSAQEVWERWRGKIIKVRHIVRNSDPTCDSDELWEVCEPGLLQEYPEDAVAYRLVVCRHQIQAGD